MNPPAAPNPAIEMTGLSIGSLRDSARTVVRDVNWSVAPGEYWVIAGLQGSGKSDFLMTAAGLLPPRQGRYRLLGEDMPIFDETRLPHRLRLGLVFDGGQLFNQLTVLENVALPLRYHQNLSKSEAEPRVRKLLEALDLAPWADSTPGAIGRNWARRAGLARALALQPEVLLLDNPLGGLDYHQGRWWLGILEQLWRGCPLTGDRPMTLVATCADLRPWEKLACRFAILRDQQFVALKPGTQLEAAQAELLDVRRLT